MRSIVDFECQGEMLVGTLDDAPGWTGLLIVSGGNEIRTGAHRGMAMLAQRVAAAGHPVLRYDRRGIGDSTGENLGYERSRPDIAAAAAHFHALLPQLDRIVAFGNGDAATALAFFHRAAGISNLVLANPWTLLGNGDADTATVPLPAAKVKDPRKLLRLVTGGVNAAKVTDAPRRAAETPSNRLAQKLGEALADAPATVLTARGDNAAIAFRAALPDVPVIERATDSHSFSGPGDADWLFEQIMKDLW